MKAFEANGTEGIDAACSEELSFTADEWKAMSEKQQQETLMNYRIAYLGETMVNWCPQLGTVLANDEVVDGVSERGGYPVVQKKMRQWCLRVSAYAQRLLDGDTMFGVTFMVLAPESELVPQVTTEAQKAEVEAYLDRTKKRTERERISDRSVTGVFSGSYAINTTRATTPLPSTSAWKSVRWSKVVTFPRKASTPRKVSSATRRRPAPLPIATCR